MRTWVVRLVGAGLVLALGIAVGAGPLQKSNQRRDAELTAQKRQVAQKLQRIAALEATGEYSAGYARATADRLVRGTLKDRSVALVVLPGADPDVVSGIRALVATAGGTVTGTVTFAPVMGKVSGRQLVEALTSQMVTQNADVQVPTGAGGYQRFGLLLARAVGLPPSAGKPAAPYDDESVGIVAGLQTADLINASPVTARAALTIAVTGPAAASTAAAGENAVPVTVLRAYATQAPVVVAGPADSAGDLGIVGSLRTGSALAGLSTVDTVDAVSGQVSAVLALAALGGGARGDWGGRSAPDGPVPTLP